RSSAQLGRLERLADDKARHVVQNVEDHAGARRARPGGVETGDNRPEEDRAHATSVVILDLAHSSVVPFQSVHGSVPRLAKPRTRAERSVTAEVSGNREGTADVRRDGAVRRVENAAARRTSEASVLRLGTRRAAGIRGRYDPGTVVHSRRQSV